MSLAASHGTDRLLTLVNAAVLQATPEALGMLLLRDDPQFARIVSGSASALVAAALEDGRRLAASVRLAWGADPYAVARRRSIPVVRCARGPVATARPCCTPSTLSVRR